MKKIIIIFLLLISIISINSCKNEDTPTINNIDVLIEKINNINTPISLNEENIINECLKLYNDLSVDDKSKITNYDKLLSYKEELDQLIKEANDNKLVQEVIDLINTIPEIDKITLSDEQKIKNARSKYNMLNEELKNRINNLKHLDDAEHQILLLKNADYTVYLINNLPDKDTITLNDKQQVENARSSYELLNDEEKAVVSNYDKLVELENQIAYLEGVEALKKQAQVVIDLINNLPKIDELSLDDANSVRTVRIRYNSLSANAKAYVTNLDTLVALENRIEELKLIDAAKKAAKAFDDAVNKLPTKANLTLDDQDAVSAARSIYNSLSDLARGYVTKLNVLVELEAQIEYLILNHEYVVKFYLNGGNLDGASMETYQEILTLNINYYSTAYFSRYQEEVFIYKTSLMTTSDTYQYAYKVGFNKVDDTYVVVSIVNDGTALDDTNKNCDYFIIVNAAQKDYTNIKNIEIGDYLDLSRDLPDNATSALNLTLIVKRGSVAEYATINYKGTNTLPTPTKDGYNFVGWYLNSGFSGDIIKEVSDEATLYARWMVDHSGITTDTILNCVSDVVESDTLYELISSNDDASFIWSSSNPNLYQIKDGYGSTSKIYQTHKKQTVEVSCTIKRNGGSTSTVKKTITINPVKFSDFPSTPIATYFYTGALSNYKIYSARYKKTGEIFSESTKKVLDILYYSFATPYSNGTLAVSSPDLINETKLLKANDVRNVLVINGVGSDTSKAFYDITKDSNLIKTFVKNVMDTVEQYNFDGVDLDWEYVSSSYPVVASQVNALAKALREEMTARSDEGGSSYLLTAAIPSSSWGLSTSRWDMPTLNKYLDYINIMSYDLNNSSRATHLSPLYSSPNDNGYGFGAVYGVNEMSRLGFSKNKLIIGAAGYGKAYKITGSATTPTYPGLGADATLTKVDGIEGSFASGTLYGSAIQAIIDKGGFTEYTEKTSSGQVVGSYLYNSTSKIFITYDSSYAIGAKYDYANSINGAGIMFWAYTEDTSDHILDTLAAKKGYL